MKCKQCGIEFVSRTWNHVYCTPKCLSDYGRKKYYLDVPVERRKYLACIARAKSKNMAFSIDEPSYYALLDGNCHYCGKERSFGVDRIDSKGGYTLDNVVSCCIDCNMMKHFISKDAFIAQCKKIASNHSNLKNFKK